VLTIDHVVIAVTDFSGAVERLSREHGLAAVEGGRHPTWGTANWIVPLGPGYVELVSVVDPAMAAQDAFGSFVQAALDAGGGPLLWCVRSDDFDATVERLGLIASTGSRQRPDGSTVRWRSAGLETATADPSRPFFIDWQLPPDQHPGRTAVAHRVTPTGIAWVEVAGDEEVVRDWLGDPEVPVRVRPGRRAVLRLGIATSSGEIVLP
jgi:Glyoxalase-like domain